MQERRYTAKETIYREGDPGDAMFIIKEGEVEVLRKVGGENARLAVLPKGAIFGEMAVLRDLPRSTTARAVCPVCLVVLPKDTFLSAFNRDNPLGLKLLRTLCERLSQAGDQLVENRLFSEGAWMRDVENIRLLPDSAEMERQIGSEGMTVGELPFRVGRHPQPGEPTQVEPAELALRSGGSEQISVHHFSIVRHEGRLAVRDLQSRLGTMVNGTRIAAFEQSDLAELTLGDNIIQTGGTESPYRFHVIVQRKAT
jgi:CRP-like cAMP-binding protein